MRATPRRYDPNAQINLAVVRGVVGVALLTTVGDFVLAALGRPVPDWTGQLMSTITAGLIGYLARDQMQPHEGQSTEVRQDETEERRPSG